MYVLINRELENMWEEIILFSGIHNYNWELSSYLLHLIAQIHDYNFSTFMDSKFYIGT